jgi:hypothetical protein
MLFEPQIARLLAHDDRRGRTEAATVALPRIELLTTLCEAYSGSTKKIFSKAARASYLSITICIRRAMRGPCTKLSWQTRARHSISLIEIATVPGRGLAGQPMKCGAKRTRLAEADIERNRGDGQLPISQ